MNPSVPPNILKAEEVWMEVSAKIRSAVLEIAARQDSGEIVIRFGSGGFKEAKKMTSL